MSLGINLTKDMQEVHGDNYKTLLREIKETYLNEGMCHVHNLKCLVL